MNIAVVTEVSTKDKNHAVIAALRDTGHNIINAGMTGAEGERELSYIHSGFISAMLLNSGAADLVVGGCGTGQGYINSVMQYPGVFCGLLCSPLDAWLFRQINGGNCISLALNKGFGWAGDVQLRFILEQFFSAEPGTGYPPHRKEPQKAARDLLFAMSAQTHRTMHELILSLPDECVLPALRFPGVVDIVRQGAKGGDIAAAIDQRLSKA